MANSVYVIGIAGLFIAFIINKIRSSIKTRQFIKAHGCKPAKQIPQSDRIIGYGLYKIQKEAIKNKNYMATLVKRFEDNGVTWSMSMVGMTVVNTIDPENVKHILATNFKDFGLGARLELFGPLLGEGIFTSDGKHWEHSRALVRPSFTRAQVADLDIFETHIRILISKIPRNGETVDLQPLLFQLTLDSATEFLFGESVHSLTSLEGSEQQKFGAAFDFAQSRFINRSRWGKLVRFHHDREFNAACKIVHDFVDKIVYNALHQDYFDEEEGEKKNRYLFVNELLKTTRDPMQLRNEMLNILLAGRDSTASLISHTFHVLVRRPDIFTKLRKEIDGLEGKRPDWETLRSLNYLRNVLTETLRLYPVVPGNARFANKATTLPRGGGPDGQSPIYIAKGQPVVYNVYTMHRRKDIYGEDANEYRPERWASENGLRPGWAYIPFNGGPRVCVGQQFALTEASYTIVRLLQEFGDIEDRDGSVWTERFGLTLASSKGVKVAMLQRP